MKNKAIVKPSMAKRDLALSLLLDGIGMLSYLFPLVGWMTDLVWAPIAGILLFRMYRGSVGAVGGWVVFIEEVLPGLDFIPTFTLTWCYVYWIKKKI